MRVHTVHVAVPDLDEALGFYRDVLGIPSGPRFGDWQTMDVEGSTAFALHGGMDPFGGQRTVVSIEVDDLDREATRIIGLGHRPLEDAPVDTGRARFLTWTDPWGTQVQLIQPT